MIDVAIAAVGLGVVAGVSRAVDALDSRRRERDRIEARRREQLRFQKARLALHRQVTNAAHELWQQTKQ